MNYCFVVQKSNVLTFDHLVKLCTDFFREEEIIAARKVLDSLLEIAYPGEQVQTNVVLPRRYREVLFKSGFFAAAVLCRRLYHVFNLLELNTVICRLSYTSSNHFVQRCVKLLACVTKFQH